MSQYVKRKEVLELIDEHTFFILNWQDFNPKRKIPKRLLKDMRKDIMGLKATPKTKLDKLRDDIDNVIYAKGVKKNEKKKRKQTLLKRRK